MFSKTVPSAVAYTAASPWVTVIATLRRNRTFADL